MIIRDLIIQIQTNKTLFKVACASTMLLAASLSVVANAKGVHLGTKGTEWDIAEPDVREVLAAQANESQEFLLDEYERLGDEASSMLDNPDGVAIPTAREPHKTKHRPRYVLDEDKFHLVKNEAGEFEWRVLFEKGTTVYPLRAIRLTSWLLVINALDEEQIELARKVINKASEEGVEVKLIVTQGALRPVMEDTQVMAYRFSEELLPSIPVKYTPSLVGQAESYDDFLTIIAQPKPYN